MFVLVGLAAGAIAAFAVPGCRRTTPESAAPAASEAAEEPGAEPTLETAALVNGARAVRGDIEETLEVTGTVRARDEVNIAAEVGATVKEVTVDEGDFVARGAVLVRLDAAQFQAQLAQAEASVALAEARLRQARHGESLQTSESDTQIAQAEAQLRAAKSKLAQAQTATALQGDVTTAQIEQARAALDAAKAQLAEVKRGAREQERRRAELLVDQAKAVYDVMERGLERRKRLLAAGGIAPDEFAAYAGEYKVRKAQYESAKQALDLTEEGATREQIAMAEAQVEQAQQALELALANRAQTQIRQRDVEVAQTAVTQAEEALSLARAAREQIEVRQEDIAAAEAGVRQAKAAVDLAETQLEKATIRAPITGLVSARLVDPGELVGPGVGIMQLIDIGYVEVHGTVSEVDIRKIAVGQSVNVKVDAFKGREFVGRVTEINPSTIPAQRFFVVKVRVPNSDGALRPGMFARMSVTIARHRDALLVPRDAIFTRDGERCVFVVRDGVARLERVREGLTRDDEIEVEGNVRPGEVVLTSGQAELADGARVEVREDGS
ncbi:MAG: efflux RND transporter periplasmic adaptor subunit [Armatimonadota bacterium]